MQHFELIKYITMAFRAISKLSRNCHCHINNRTHYCLAYNNSSVPLLSHPNRSYHNHQDGNEQGQQDSKWNGIIPIAAGLSTATIIAGLSINSSTDKSTDKNDTKSFLEHPCFPCKSVLAEEKCLLNIFKLVLVKTANLSATFLL